MQTTNPFRDKTIIPFLVIAFLLGGGVFFSVQEGIKRIQPTPPPENSTQSVKSSYKISRLQGYQNINPVLSVETAEKSERFASLIEELKKLEDTLKTAGTITQASIFLKEFERGEWTSLYSKEKYHPASLMKVVLLLGYLRLAENSPDLFEQKWLFEKPENAQNFPQYYATKSIEPGKSYTVHELLLYMTAHSDNNATWMLASRLDKSILQKIFVEFGLQPPAEFDMNLLMTAREYSTFINAIYNASNLSPEYAEYAAELMKHCSFQEGFFKGFPSNTQMWHKFGQWKSGDSDHELHESGIVHIKGKPYLLTIMTKGKDTEKLAEAIRAFCKRIYDEIPSP